MSKILFVDDEITKNIPALTLLFGSFLSKNELIKLEQLKRDPLGPTIGKIHEILKENPVLTVESTFAEAISRIKEAGDGRDYDLFLLDRNLAGNGMYQLKEIAEIMPGYDENALERYKGREGDFLLLLLYLQNVPCREKVYFYSAYRADEIRSALYLQHMIGYETFSWYNFVDKSDQKSKMTFRNEVVAQLKRAPIVARYRSAFNGLSKAKLNVDRDRLIDIMKEDSHPNADARVLLEYFMEVLKSHGKNYFKTEPKDNLDFAALNYDTWNNPIGQTVPQFVFNHCLSVKRFCSNYTAHRGGDDPSLPKPTSYSWMAVKYMLAEIFTWLDKVL